MGFTIRFREPISLYYMNIIFFLLFSFFIKNISYRFHLDVVMINKNKKIGYVYCLSNPSFKQNIFKIGYTLKNTPEERAKSLYKTGIPTPFVVEFYIQVENPRKKEGEIHKLFDCLGYRCNKKREFFNVNIDIVKQVFLIANGTKTIEKTEKEN